MRNEAHWHIICYDIADPRRLRKVHKLLKSESLYLQRSIYAYKGTRLELAQLKQKILTKIDLKEDLVWGYQMPKQAFLHYWGKSPFMEGVYISNMPPSILHTKAPNHNEWKEL